MTTQDLFQHVLYVCEKRVQTIVNVPESKPKMSALRKPTIVYSIHQIHIEMGCSRIQEGVSAGQGKGCILVTMVLWAPETAGPWSAVTTRHISKNLQQYLGRRRWNLANTRLRASHPITSCHVKTDKRLKQN